jgi:hypothetical protein
MSLVEPESEVFTRLFGASSDSVATLPEFVVPRGESGPVSQEIQIEASFRSLRNPAQLLHHPEQIPADPFLYNFAFLYTVDDNTHPTRLPVGWL